MRLYESYYWNTTCFDNVVSSFIAINECEYSSNYASSCLYRGNCLECRTSSRDYVFNDNDAITCLKWALNQLPGSMYLCLFANCESA